MYAEPTCLLSKDMLSTSVYKYKRYVVYTWVAVVKVLYKKRCNTQARSRVYCSQGAQVPIHGVLYEKI